MKKFTALLLCVAMLMVGVVAQAETGYEFVKEFLTSEDGENLRIPLIIVPNPATSSPPTRISRKSAIQAHCLHAK